MEGRTDLRARTFAFARAVLVTCIRKRPGSPAIQEFIRQLMRCATSVGANIEEAQASESRRDFLHKYAVACKEAREANYWLRLLVDTRLVPEAEFRELAKESDELIAILTTIIKRTKANALSAEVQAERRSLKGEV